jgi:hypothetical protein
MIVILNVRLCETTYLMMQMLSGQLTKYYETDDATSRRLGLIIGLQESV